MGQSARERREDLERSVLSGWAASSTQSKGRERAEAPDALRTVFEVDRDRILASTAFRGLQDKTHRFVAARGRDSDPPFRTRLTHVLAVARVARGMARGVRANEDLTEAIALGADLGATPFGDAGELALADMLAPPFRVVEQSLRTVEVLEAAGRGLNLSWEVRDGILHNSPSMPPAATIEGQLARLANRVTEVAQDLEDACRAGLVSRDELPAGPLAVLGTTGEDRVAAMVGDLVATSAASPEPGFSERVEEARRELDLFAGRKVGHAPAVRHERDRAMHVVASLVVYLLEHPDELPRTPRADDTPEQRVVDHLAGLGDRATSGLFMRLFMPGSAH